MRNKFLKAERISLKNHPELDEKWVQKLISDDPSILGLGDLAVRDIERPQPRAGRLDLLLQDLDTNRRYEVELQLGATDASHIIRSIEYFDIEKKRYPQYDHCAVLVAEDITSRFLNVIWLFNGTLPIIAIQMQAFRVGDQVTLVFTKVIDELPRGLVDEDEDAKESTDRSYWEKQGTKATVGLADEMLKLVQEINPSLRLKYNKYYIGLEIDGRSNNFVLFRPKKNHFNVEFHLPKSDLIDAKIDEAGLDALEYNNHFQRYKLRLTKADIATKADVLRELSQLAYDRRQDG